MILCPRGYETTYEEIWKPYERPSGELHHAEKVGVKLVVETLTYEQRTKSANDAVSVQTCEFPTWWGMVY